MFQGLKALGYTFASGYGAWKVLIHEKAVPAMMGGRQKTHHGGTANGHGKDACPSAEASQVVDRLDA
jgi:hypothetical protein